MGCAGNKYCIWLLAYEFVRIYDRLLILVEVSIAQRARWKLKSSRVPTRYMPKLSTNSNVGGRISLSEHVLYYLGRRSCSCFARIRERTAQFDTSRRDCKSGKLAFSANRKG